jgi:hypothetical protein
MHLDAKTGAWPRGIRHVEGGVGELGSVCGCRITGIISRCISCATMPNNRLDPTSILLRSYLYQIMYTSVAPTRKKSTIIEQNAFIVIVTVISFH